MTGKGFRDRRLERELCLTNLDRRASLTVFTDLTTYLATPLQAIADEYWVYHTGADLIAQKRVGDAREEKDVLAYYQVTPHYLYELSYWEASADKQAWFKVVATACKKFRWQRVMDMGGGVGGLTLYLNRRGIRCDYLDVAGKTFDYAAWRFHRHDVTPAMFDVRDPTRQPQGPYDAIFAWDVLEHIFDLEGAIQRVASLLRPNGWFITKSTFATTGGQHEAIHLAQHACYQDVKELNRLFIRCGFRFIGQLKPNGLSRLLRSCGFAHTVAGIRIVQKLKHGGNFLIHERFDGAEARA